MPDQTREPLTEQQLDDIDARRKAASRGPWTPDYEYCDCSENCGHGLYVTRINTGAGPATELCDLPREEWELMVHAREDVDALAAEVRRLRDKAQSLGELAARRESELIALRGPSTGTDTLPEWLYQRFARYRRHAPTWGQLTDDDQAYWEHEAHAVRRAVARGGFKAAARPAGAASEDTNPRPQSFAEAMANPIDRAVFADSLDIALGGGCGLCDTEADHMCVGCGKCRCFDHDTCTRN